jgi:hypothetical protein
VRIGYLSAHTPAPALRTDTAAMIRAHRDNPRHRRIIAAYRAAHPLCQRCIAEARTCATEEIHHIRQVSERGLTTDANLLALCLACHHSIGGVPEDQQRAWKAQGMGIEAGGGMGGVWGQDVGPTNLPTASAMCSFLPRDTAAGGG